MSLFLSQIILVPFDFAPKGFAFCNGQLLPINQNQALFALLGTTFGGNGTSTFALPDLRGRVPVGMGQGPGLSNYTIGEIAGTTSVALTLQNVPIHNHLVLASNSNGTVSAPNGNFLANATGGITPYHSGSAGASTPMAGAMVASSGQSFPHENRQPYLGLQYCIGLQGIFPSRN